MKPVKNTKKTTTTPAPTAKSVVKPVIETKTAKAAAPAPQAVKPVTAVKPAPTSAPVTTPAAKTQPIAKSIAKPSHSATITAKIDVGFGNTLYLRGEGKGLNWEHGIPLTNVDECTWQWSGEADDKLKVKLLINDAVWQKGEDVVVAPGEKVQIAPAF